MKDIWLKNMKSFLVFSFFLLLDVLGEIFMALLFGEIVDKASSKDLSATFFLVIETLIFTVVTVFITWLYKIYGKKFIYLMLRDTKVKIFSDIQKLNNKQFYTKDIGEKISLLTNDMSILEQDYFLSIILSLKAFILFLFSLITIFMKSYQVALLLLFLTLFSLILPKFFGKKLDMYKKEYSDSQSFYTARTTEYLNGFDIIKSFGITEIIKKEFFSNADSVFKKGMKYQKSYYFISSVSIFLGSITFMGGFLFGGYLVAKGIITLGTMIVCIQLTNHLTNPVYSFIENYTSLKSVSQILKKIENISENISKSRDIGVIHNNLIKGIDVKNVTFSYDKKEIMKNINYSFEKKKKYAIVGLSGSGKSTFLKLLAGKIKATSGSIIIDDIDVNELNERSILNLFSWINQNVFLFKGSIFDNITLYNVFSKEKAEEILKIVGLEKFIKEMENKESVAENGINLSGGEKQRISIARALIRENDILLADEAFSNLDNETALKIEKELLKLENITLIAVTHRLFEETLRNFDEILVLDNGKIIEKGTYNELINKKSFFYKMYSLSKND